MMFDQPPAAVAPAEDAQALYDAGVQARRDGDAARAAPLLRRAAELRPNDADVLLQYGLALYGIGRLDEAAIVLDRAQALAPAYAEVTLARARVAAARRDRSEARRLAAPLAQAGNADAAAFLGQLDRPEEAQALPWRIDAWGTVSDLSGPRRDWNSQGLAVSRRGRDGSLSLSIERTERFGQTDVYVEGTASRDFQGWSAWAAIGGAPDADHRAEVSLAAGLVGPEADFAGGTVRGVVDVRWSRYPIGEVQTLRPGVVWQGDRIDLQARWIVTRDENDETRHGYLVQAGIEATDRLRLEASYADAPESSEGRTLDVQATGLAARWRFSDRLDGRLGVVNEERGDGSTRREAMLAFTRRF